MAGARFGIKLGFAASGFVLIAFAILGLHNASVEARQLNKGFWESDPFGSGLYALVAMAGLVLAAAAIVPALYATGRKWLLLLLDIPDPDALSSAVTADDAIAVVDRIGLAQAPFAARDHFLAAFQAITQPHFSMGLVGKWATFPWGYNHSLIRRFVERMLELGLVRIPERPIYQPTWDEMSGFKEADRYVVEWTPLARIAGRALNNAEQAFLGERLRILRTTMLPFGGPAMSARDVFLLLCRCTPFFMKRHFDELKNKLELPALTEDELRGAVAVLREQSCVELSEWQDRDVHVLDHYLYGRDLSARAQREQEAQRRLETPPSQSASGTEGTPP